LGVIFSGELIVAASTLSQQTGPHSVVSAAYAFDPKPDQLVLKDDLQTKVQMAGQVWRPQEMRRALPVIILLHGNHQTCGIPQEGWRADVSCEFTFEGVCDSPKVEVPSHLGFSYMAEKMASWGFVVVSMNVNRGINCNFGAPSSDSNLILARGRMILRTLQLLSEWNRGLKPTPIQIGASLKGRLDFSQVGLMGHSRGGEGARAAIALYRDQGSHWPRLIPDRLHFKALFEIAPTDGQTDRILNPTDLAWALLLGSCDGDLWRYPGARIFNRLADAPLSEVHSSLKSVFYVIGANHNFFNTEWTTSDSMNCLEANPVFNAQTHTIQLDEWTQQIFYVGSSDQQQHLAQTMFLNLMRGNLGPRADSRFNILFDTAYRLPPSLSSLARIERAFLPALDATENPILADFNDSSGSTGHVISSEGMQSSLELGTDVYFTSDYLDQQIQHGLINWSSKIGPSYLQINFGNPDTGMDARPFEILDFRLSRQVHSMEDLFAEAEINLVNTSGHLSAPLSLSSFAQLQEPSGYVHPFPFLQTLSIPLRSFRVSEQFLGHLRGLRFSFKSSSAGALNLDEIRLRSPSLDWISGGALDFVGESEALRSSAKTASSRPSKPSVILASEPLRSEAVMSQQAATSTDRFKMEIQATRGFFPVGGAELQLHMGGAPSKPAIRWKDPRRLDTLVIEDLSRSDISKIDRTRRAGKLKLLSGAREWVIK
jgi:hypothetical protein